MDLISQADGSAAALVNLLAEHFPCFRDEFEVERRKVRFLKRAQIFVADLWAAFDGDSYGSFHDIDQITMFADYRIPQILHTLGCLSHSPPLAGRIQRQEEIQSGHSWEIQLRGKHALNSREASLRRRYPSLLIRFDLQAAASGASS